MTFAFTDQTEIEVTIDEYLTTRLGQGLPVALPWTAQGRATVYPILQL